MAAPTVGVQPQAIADVRHPATVDIPPLVMAVAVRLPALAEAAIRLRVTVAVRHAVVEVDRMAAADRTAVAADMGGKIALVCFSA